MQAREHKENRENPVLPEATEYLFPGREVLHQHLLIPVYTGHTSTLKTDVLTSSTEQNGHCLQPRAIRETRANRVLRVKPEPPVLRARKERQAQQELKARLVLPVPQEPMEGPSSGRAAMPLQLKSTILRNFGHTSIPLTAVLTSIAMMLGIFLLQRVHRENREKSDRKDLRANRARRVKQALPEPTELRSLGRVA